MTETVKTLIYAGLAIALGAVALWVNLPPRETVTPESEVLYADFKDSKDAARLEIVRVDEAQGKLDRFEVERMQGRWVIPSHGNYPADAQAQMTDAATSLIDLNIIGIASDNPSDQELFGVVEPTESRLEAGDKGFGMLVAFQDTKGEDLARLIVGKQVKDSPTQRFVRKAGQNRVYVVDLDVSKLTTNFSDWIEKDLLKISPWDIDRLTVKDYRFIVKPAANGFSLQLDPRLEATIGWDNDGNSWELLGMSRFVQQRPVPTELQADEELNKEKLDELKSALDNLQIVNVLPKPKGLGENVTDEEAFQNPEFRESLQNIGVMPAQIGRKRELLGSNGELNVGTKDGVEYVLRFGNSAGADEGTTKDGDVKVRRYLYVTARLDESRLKPPALQELPTESTVPVAPTEPAAPPAASDAPEAAPEATEAPAPGDACQAADEPAAEPSDEQPAPEAPATEAPAAAPPADEAPKSDFDLKRKQIEKENQRKMDEYHERRRKAEAKVRELNARFAGWYYVISDDEFQKIHLTRSDLVKERSGPGAETYGVDALRELQEQGPLKPAPVPQPPAGGLPGGLPPGLNFGQ